MTVADLVAALSRLPQERKVVLWSECAGTFSEVHGVCTCRVVLGRGEEPSDVVEVS